jgi:adenine-specific DNA-methyltransferase
MSRKQRLELTWIGKEDRPRLEPRIMLEEIEKSYHAKQRVSDGDIFDNRLIFGDNLLALKALEQEFIGKIKCIYIDPPFNTGEAFEHYNDGLEHSIWLSLMRDRIKILHALLSTDGTFAVHIDDNELGYLIALCDEIFGRTNRLYVVTFKQSSVSGPKAINPGIVTIANYIVLYAKDKGQWKPNRVLQPIERDRRYTKFIENYEDEFSLWRLIGLRDAVSLEQGIPKDELKSVLGDDIEDRIDEFVLRNAERVVRTARVKDKDVNEDARAALQRSRVSREVVTRSQRVGKSDYYFLNGEQLLFYKSKVKEINGQSIAGVGLSNIWDDLLSNNLHKEGGVEFPKGKKPEALIKRIVELATAPGDWVLDSFAGSGTTGAVSHKMGRHWVMVELGEHCHTHIVPRLKRVVDGEDLSGISQSENWQGGGGFRYYRLAPSLLEKDRWGNWIISNDYNPAMLTEAVCKLMGFTYAPSEQNYWMHGRSSESDFIFVTTQSLTHEQLKAIAAEVGEDRTLLICCKAFRAHLDAFPNLTVRKIPQAVLRKCEWGKDDYSLNVANLAMAAAKSEEADLSDASAKANRGNPAQDDLFAGARK